MSNYVEEGQKGVDKYGPPYTPDRKDWPKIFSETTITGGTDITDTTAYDWEHPQSIDPRQVNWVKEADRKPSKAISLAEVNAVRQELWNRSQSLVAAKGSDYNRKQQAAGDTLFNLRVCKLLGIVEHETQGVMVRLCDKLMRLASLTSDPMVNPEVKDESVMETIADMWNYSAYLLAFYREERRAS